MIKYNVWIRREQHFLCENVEAESEQEARAIASVMEMSGEALALGNDVVEVYNVEVID